MGFFTGKKKTYVSSVLYNLAGDTKDRTDYLKTVTTSAFIGNIENINKNNFLSVFQESYLQGSGVKLRAYNSWAQTNLVPQLRQRTSNYSNTSNISLSKINDELHNYSDGYDFRVTTAITGKADYTYWAEQWIMNNHSDLANKEYTTSYDTDTNTITIISGSDTYTFEPTGINNKDRYLYVLFSKKRHKKWYGEVLIYTYQSGNTNLDNMFSITDTTNNFLPPIPIRIDNEFVSDTHYSDIYPLAKKAFYRATGNDYSKLTKLVNDNKNLKDIDYAHVVWGVSLNTTSKAGLKYIYSFFKKILDDNISSAVDWTSYNTEYSNYLKALQAYEQANQDYWKKPSDTTTTSNNTKLPPSPPSVPVLPIGDIIINVEAINYSIKISFNTIGYSSGSGIVDPNHKAGDIWISYGDSLDLNYVLYTESSDEDATTESVTSNINVNSVNIYWQKDSDHWYLISIKGLVHKNFVYNGHAVETDAEDALKDTDESGFLIPLNSDVFKTMNILDYTQLATECSYIIFNCYKVVKQKWYQTGFFKLLVFMAVIAIAVFTGGAGAVGILGANGAIGGALGLSGLAATVVGAVANTIAAIIAVKLVSKISVIAFGKKFGTLIGAVLSTVGMIVAGSIQSGAKNITAVLNSFTKADNLLSITNSVNSGVSNIMTMDAQHTLNKTQDVITDYGTKSKNITDLYETNIGVNGDQISGNMSNTLFNNILIETNDSFLSRCLMTGSDIANMSLNMVNDFTSMSLDLDNIKGV